MAGRVPTSARERFDEKCRPAENGCIEWTGGRTPNGYGLFHVGPGKRMVPAHRWAFEQAHGEQPRTIDVCHRCDNRACVALEHLFAGSRAENMADCRAKRRTTLGRARPSQQGEKHHKAKLVESDIAEIRAWHGAGWPMTTLSDAFGVSVAHVSRIVHQQTWKHLS